jgi:hypothetical protein
MLAFSADQLLLTLKVESSTVGPDEFLLTLEIYGVPSDKPPDVVIDGFDQFRLNNQGRNLLQVPGGKTVKWILNYYLTPMQDGTFKVGPARARIEGRTYSSNTLFITVKGTGKSAPAPVEKKSEAKQPEEPKTPLIRSAAELGDKVLILAETNRSTPYLHQGLVVTYRLLAQLPVDSLRFTDEAEFPGFLKYDYPYVSRPTADRIRYQGQSYVAYDLQRFLIFPLHEGIVNLRPIDCELKVRVPSGKFAAADLILDARRASNALQVRVKPLPKPALVGSFVLKNEIVSDGPRSKVIRVALEGDGLLSTFDVPSLQAVGGQVRSSSTSTNATIRGQKLFSRKTAEFEVAPEGNTTDVVLQSLQITQFDPDRGNLTTLTLPPMSLKFSTASAPKVTINTAFPDPSAPFWMFSILSAAFSCAILLYRFYQPRTKPKPPQLVAVFRKKNPKLQLSRNAAHLLYQQISDRILGKIEDGTSLMDVLKHHLPQEEWLNVERTFKKLEWSAYSPSRGPALTYGELKSICKRVEKQWIL